MAGAGWKFQFGGLVAGQVMKLGRRILSHKPILIIGNFFYTNANIRIALDLLSGTDQDLQLDVMRVAATVGVVETVVDAEKGSEVLVAEATGTFPGVS